MDEIERQSEASDAHQNTDTKSADASNLISKGGDNKQTSKSYNPDYYGDEQIDRFVDEFFLWLRDKKTGPHEWLVAIATVVLMFVACVQLAVSCSSSTQTDKLINAADRNAAAADRFADAAAGINTGVMSAVTQLGIQAGATKGVAGASESAANTAKETLHVSQRAYISVSNPQFDFPAGNINLTFANVGHIPSGKGTITMYEVSADNPDPSQSGIAPPIERHWRKNEMIVLAVGTTTEFHVSIPKLIAEKVNDGHQIVRIGGVISYNDGFNDSAPQEQKFCMYSVYDFKAKRVTWATSENPEKDVTQLIQVVGYPDNEQK